MDEEQINIFERGVQLPTDGQWVDVPGCPFQVMTRGTDQVGLLWVRMRPDIQPNHWTSWVYPDALS